MKLKSKNHVHQIANWGFPLHSMWLQMHHHTKWLIPAPHSTFCMFFLLWSCCCCFHLIIESETGMHTRAILYLIILDNPGTASKPRPKCNIKQGEQNSSLNAIYATSIDCNGPVPVYRAVSFSRSVVDIAVKCVRIREWNRTNFIAHSAAIPKRTSNYRK